MAVAVRFADLTGNGRADYLCIAPDGHVKGSVQNNDGSFTNVGQIKVSADKDRANLRFADVNGDGKDDLVWVCVSFCIDLTGLGYSIKCVG